MKIEDFKLGDSKFFACFKGGPGSGKSIGAASFPNVYIFDFDDRIRSVVAWYRRNFPNKKDIEFDSYYGDWTKFARKLDQLINHNSYEALCLDTLSTISRSILRGVLRYRVGEARREKKDFLQVDGIQMQQIEDYNAETSGLIQTFDALKSISAKYIIINAHLIVVEQRDRKNRITSTRSLLTGGKKIAAELPVYFNEAWNFYVEPGFEGGQKFMAVTQAAGEDWAKSTLPLPETMDFTNRLLFEVMMENLKDEEVPVINPSTPILEPNPTGWEEGEA